MKRDWTLDQLDVFCCVARRSSFSAAAQELGISAAYVTKRIAQLERAMGVMLFNRTTRRVHITTEGETAYTWARKLLEAADGLHNEVHGGRESPTGTLRISTSMRLGRNHVSPILSMLARRHPGLDIWLELVDRRVDLIGEGFDIDIRVGEVSEPHLVVNKIVDSTRILAAAPAYLRRRGRPRSLAEMAHHDCLLFRDREQTFGLLRMDGPQGTESVKVTSRMGSNHSDPVRQWALDGHGIVLLSAWDIAADLRAGKVERVLPQYRQPADVNAVMPMRSGQSPKLRTCVDFLRRHLSTGPYRLDTTVE